jgi:hypothetical protein
VNRLHGFEQISSGACQSIKLPNDNNIASRNRSTYAETLGCVGWRLLVEDLLQPAPLKACSCLLDCRDPREAIQFGTSQTLAESGLGKIVQDTYANESTRQCACHTEFAEPGAVANRNTEGYASKLRERRPSGRLIDMDRPFVAFAHCRSTGRPVMLSGELKKALLQDIIVPPDPALQFPQSSSAMVCPAS